MDPSFLLRRTLLANATFSALSGLACILASEPIATAIGLDGSLRLLGVLLLVFAADLVWEARCETPRIWMAGIFCSLDILWVVGTAALLLFSPEALNTAGKWAAVAVAGAVACFAVLQIIGMRRLTRARRRRQDASRGSAISMPRAEAT